MMDMWWQQRSRIDSYPIQAKKHKMALQDAARWNGAKFEALVVAIVPTAVILIPETSLLC